MEDNRNELKSLRFVSIAAHFERMSGKGNLHCFAMFGEGSNFVNPPCPMRRRSPTSREDSCLNHEEGSALLAPPITAEICASSLINDNVKKKRKHCKRSSRVIKLPRGKSRQ